jgi:hypothetical protein
MFRPLGDCPLATHYARIDGVTNLAFTRSWRWPDGRGGMTQTTALAREDAAGGLVYGYPRGARRDCGHLHGPTLRCISRGR